MKLIIGLGNPGEKYQGTRHNLGFQVVEELRRKLDASEWSEEEEKNSSKEQISLF